MVAEGVLGVHGSGRATHYRAAERGWVRKRYARPGLEEDRVWDALRADVPALATLPPAAARTAAYAFLEMVNNAIDHSGSQDVEVGIDLREGIARFEVLDWGIGVFENVCKKLGLATHLEALQEISKGKTTTMPDRHSGEGIFFVSKAVRLFEIDSSGLQWIVDNVRHDLSVGESAPRSGTRVYFEIDPRETRPLEELFAEYTQDYEFSRTRTVVRLFQIGVLFLSRSEARRLMNGLEKFREVVLDFDGVGAVGQGFVDEVFRVWARAHPETVLIPVNMKPPVEFMVKRGIGKPS